MIAAKLRYLRAFTLIELLVVISIIGLLSSVVLVSLQSARDKGRIAAGLRFEQHVRSALGDKMIADYIFDESNCISESGIPKIISFAGNSFDLKFVNPTDCNTILTGDSPINNAKSIKLLQAGNLQSGGSPVSIEPFSDDIFIGFWVKATLPANWATAPAFVLRDDAGEIIKISMFSMTNANQAQRGIGYSSRSGQPYLVAPSVIYDEKWHYVAFSQKGQNLTAYVDGKVYGTTQVVLPGEVTKLRVMLNRFSSNNGALLMSRLTVYTSAI